MPLPFFPKQKPRYLKFEIANTLTVRLFSRFTFSFSVPLFAFTLLKALLRLSFFRIFPSMSGSALSLSFHIRLNERCALTYPLRSALFFCEQLSMFSTLNVRPSSGSYLRLLLIRPFIFRLLWPRLTSVRSALLSAVVTSFNTYRTDLPGYHTFLSLHLPASSIPCVSV